MTCHSHPWIIPQAKYRFGLKKPFCEEVKKSEKVLVAQSCLTLHDLMDCSPPGSSVDGSLQARIPEWVAIPFSRQSSWPKDRTQVSWIVGRLFIIWATREAPDKLQMLWNFNSSSSSEYSELSCCRRLGPIYGYYTYPYNVPTKGVENISTQKPHRCLQQLYSWLPNLRSNQDALQSANG